MSRAKILLAGAVALAGVLVPAASGLAWQSDNFQSPSGNILCRHDSRNGVVACMTLNDTFVAAVGLYGGSYKTHGGTFAGGPVLYYGGLWTASNRFRCNSSYAGMTCRSTLTGHGFFINRTSYRLF